MYTVKSGDHVMVNYNDPDDPKDIRTYPAEVLQVNGDSFDCRWHASNGQVSCGLPISAINHGGEVCGEAFVGFGSAAQSKDIMAGKDIVPVTTHPHFSHQLGAKCTTKTTTGRSGCSSKG